MGKIKKILRAQRKFAQGAYIPPQSHPPTSASATVTHASHRAVNTPGPVIHNSCTVKDILTRMSLARAHPHSNVWQPVVRIDYDCGSALVTPEGKKLKGKKNSKVSNLKKKYVLRNRQKASNIKEKRRVSISDSGEDTPLSYLASRENVNMPIYPIRGAVRKCQAVKQPDPLIRRLPPSQKRRNTASLNKTSAPNSDTILLPIAATNAPRMADKKTKLFQEEAPASQYSLPVPSCSSQAPPDASIPSCSSTVLPNKFLVPSHTSPLLPLKLPSPPSTSPLSACTSPVVPHNPQVLLRTSPALPMAPPALVSNLRKRQSKSYQDTAFTYTFSDTTSVKTDNLSDGSDPDYEHSTSGSTGSSEYSIKKRPKAFKKIIGNKRECNVKRFKVSPAQQVNDSNQSLVAGEEDSVGFQSSSGSSLFHGITIPDVKSDSSPIQPLESTAQWIDSHHQLGMLSSTIEDSSTSIPPDSITGTTTVNTRLTSTGSIVYSTPGIITINSSGSSKVTSTNTRLTVSGNIVYTTPGIISINGPGCSKSTTQVNRTSEKAAGDESHFKLPHLPVYRTKHAKHNICSTRFLNGLQELLNHQPNMNEIICHTCKRCELLSEYKKVVKKLPISNANELDILESTPPDVYDFDSDDEGFLRRGRELVRNVLTTKRLPIWLSNLQMPLKKTMFQDEHKLGTLKRNIIFEKNDITDPMVSKIVTRIDYLNRCILEDKKELDAEKSRRRLRSAKRASMPVSRKSLQKRRELSMSAPVTAPFDETEDIVDDNNTYTDMNYTDPEVPAEASTPPRPASAKERLMVLRLTPLEEMAGPSTTNATNPVSNTEPRTVYIDDDISMSKGGCLFEVGREGFAANSNFENHRPIKIIDDEDDIPLKPTPIVDDPRLFEFRPTPEEFKDPIAYIGKIQRTASKYGICKIIPPAGFNVPCHLDDNCMFTTTNQYLCRLFQRWGVTSRELTIIQTYVATLANSRERDQFLKVPMFDGVELDLVKLYHIVLKHGGIEELLAHSEKWARIAEEMRLVSPRGKPDHKKLEKLYCKHVLPYESLSQFDRHSIQMQVDRMWGERSKSAMGRAQRPLLNQWRMLGRGQIEYEDELLLSEPEFEGVREIGQQFLDKVEECTGKGRTMNLATYRRIAAQIQAMRFSNGPEPTISDLEEEYFDLLTLAQEHVAVLSACIDTSVDGLGHTSDPAGPGGSHPWNLKRLSENPRNVLSSLGKTLSVTVPTLCLNQLFSTNCWHMDPHKLAWMDYMHEGPTKVWYAVSAHDADKFRRAMSVVSPTVAQKKGIWLASDTTMVPPSLLSARGVKINRVEQREGEFIVVFPDAIASSFATGLTISESVYFGSKSWLHLIDHIFRQLRLDCEPAMFSNTLLLFRMARDPAVSVELLPRVHNSIKLLIQDELDTRREAKKFNCNITLDQSGRPDEEQRPISWPHQDECYICRAPLTLSRTVRYNDHRALMCLKHGLRSYSVAPREERGECGPPVTLLYDYSELQDINNTIENRIRRALGPTTKDEHG